MAVNGKPHVLVLGGNFAGLGSAQKIREYAGDTVNITVMDRKSYLLFIPNIPTELFENRDPGLTLHMDIVEPLANDRIAFIQGDVVAIDVEAKRVNFVPSERPGAATESIRYDYLVIALGARLAYDKIDGFAEHGHALSDIYYGNKLRHYLHDGDYHGGPIAIGSARFHQGSAVKDLVPMADAACEGPPVEAMLSMATWLGRHDLGGADKVTVFTPGKMIAEDAGVKVVTELLGIATKMGFHYLNETQDISRITSEGIEFANGKSVEAELKIVLPDWVPHGFLHGLPIADERGFVVTDLTMRHPKYREILAAGDAAAVTVPKLGAIGHQECEIVGKQIAKDMGRMSAEQADAPLAPVVLCIGDMGNNQAFYIRSNSYFGGDTQVLKIGHVPFLLKMQYKKLFFTTHGKVPLWGLDVAESLAEKLF